MTKGMKTQTEFSCSDFIKTERIKSSIGEQITAVKSGSNFAAAN